MIIVLILYSVPTVVALLWHHHNELPIGAVNFFVGWKFGWAAGAEGR